MQIDVVSAWETRKTRLGPKTFFEEVALVQRGFFQVALQTLYKLSDTCFAMDALHCATFLCTYPLNSIAVSLSITAVVLARGGIYLRSALAAYMCWILLDPSPTKGGYEPLELCLSC